LAGELHGAVESDSLAFYRPEAKGEAAARWLAQGAAYKFSNGGGCAAWHRAGLPATVRRDDGAEAMASLTPATRGSRGEAGEAGRRAVPRRRARKGEGSGC
jgi:hypothetical protein